MLITMEDFDVNHEMMNFVKGHRTGSSIPGMLLFIAVERERISYLYHSISYSKVQEIQSAFGCAKKESRCTTRVD